MNLLDIAKDSIEQIQLEIGGFSDWYATTHLKLGIAEAYSFVSQILKSTQMTKTQSVVLKL